VVDWILIILLVCVSYVFGLKFVVLRIVLFECGRILRYTNCFNSVCFEYDIEVDNFPAQYHVKQIVYKKFEACVLS